MICCSSVLHGDVWVSHQGLADSDRTHGRVDYLDGWRGMAIISVLISHFLPATGFSLGKFGVDVFFVLSGMLMSNILFVKRTAITTFYKRRISGILPVFVVFVSLVYGVAAWLQLSPEYHNYGYTLTFLRSYLPANPNIWDTGLPVGHLCCGR